MRNKLLISGLIVLLIAALVISANAVDVISVSELFNSGGDAQEEVAAVVSDAPEEDSYAPVEEDTSVSDPASEPAVDDTADSDTAPAEDTAPVDDTASDNDTDNSTDSTADDDIADNDTAGEPADNDIPDEGTENAATETPETDELVDASGELTDIDVPALEAVTAESIEDTSNIVISISKGTPIVNGVALEGGMVMGGDANVATAELIAEKGLESEWATAGGNGILVEIPVYISAPDGPRITGAVLSFLNSFTTSDGKADGSVRPLSPVLSDEFIGYGFNVSIPPHWTGRVNVTFDDENGCMLSREQSLLVTLRYYFPAQLAAGNFALSIVEEQNANGQIDGYNLDRNCYFYNHLVNADYDLDICQIYAMDSSGWSNKVAEVTHEHVVENWNADPSFDSKTYPATCTTDGYVAGTCSSANCPYYTQHLYKEAPKLGHTIDREDVYHDPTCVKDGNYAFAHCETCGKLLDPDAVAEDIYTTEYLTDDKGAERTTEVIPALGHDLKTVDYLAPTCVAAGHVEHQICVREGCEPGLTFDMDGVQYERPGKIQPNGELIPMNPANHDGHLKEIEAKDPTCAATGNYLYWECESCHNCYTEETGNPDNVTTVKEQTIDIDPANHVDDLTEIEAKDPTCAETGNNQYWHCENCDKYFTDEDGTPDNETTVEAETIEIDPANHVEALTEIEAKDATCVSTGNNQYWYCEHCEKYFTDEDGTPENETTVEEQTIDIDPTNHGEALTEIEAVEANCVEGINGNKQYWHCEHCDKYFTDEAGTPENETTVEEQIVYGDSHDFVTVPAVEQNCITETDAVAKHQICSRSCCAGIVFNMDGEPTTLEELTTPFTHTKPADPNEIQTVDGYIVYICTVCGQEIQEPIEGTDSTETASGRYAPHTDDSSTPLLWAMLICLGLSLAGLTAVTAGRRKYSR